jgi:uncharacterized protein (TIGR00255 family)
MHSMTGFGRGDATNGSTSVTVELRSVNHRFKDINVKVPREYTALEPRIIALVRDRIGRGRVDCTVRRLSPEGQLEVVADQALAQSCFKAMQEMARSLGRTETAVDLGMVFSQPGVLNVQERDLDIGHEWEILEPALECAMDHLTEMRATEGAAIRRDLQLLLGQFIRLRNEMASTATQTEDKIRKKLEERLLRMLGAEHLDPARVVQEAAILADKADISEELARLGSHCDQMRDIFIGTEAAGRKVEFLLQEMSREVNTIGSKAAGQQSSQLVIEMKAVIERMREQVANVE